MTELTELVGKVIKEITGMEKESDEVVIITQCGKAYSFYHEEDCCEYVRLVDFECDASSGDEILSADLVESEAKDNEIDDESGTWSFYKIETTGGEIWMRWLGESNGCYSESSRFLRKTT